VIAGHFGLAALVKSRATYIPLWALMLATVWLDVVFVPLFLSGVETLEPASGTHGGYGNAVIHADYTHSLVGALALSALFGAAFLRALGTRAACLLGAVSFSHWLLDLIVHRADLTLVPRYWGPSPQLGFGLWRLPFLAASMELALIVAGTWGYWRASRSATIAAGIRSHRADTAGLLMIGFGVLVLALDVTGP
jgi:hypothetical protein